MLKPFKKLKGLFPGTPTRVKILDYQALKLGHPALNIWSIVNSTSDADYRVHHLEEDLQAYFDILAGYTGTEVDYTDFRQELKERRVMAMVIYGRSRVPWPSTSNFM